MDTYLEQAGGDPAKAIDRMMRQIRERQYRVTKEKITCRHPKLGKFDLYLEINSGHTLPVVIHGEPGRFVNGHWRSL